MREHGVFLYSLAPPNACIKPIGEGGSMACLAGYKLKEQISRSSSSIVFRGIRESDNRPVVIKLLANDYPSTKEITDFIHEYQIMTKIDSAL
jgi:protein kinase